MEGKGIGREKGPCLSRLAGFALSCLVSPCEVKDPTYSTCILVSTYIRLINPRFGIRNWD